MAASSDSFKAGLFVIVGLVLGFTAIVMLSNIEGMFEKKQIVTVRFSLKDGLQGLKEGALVTLGNYPVGTVKSISDEETDGQVTAKLVQAQIPARYKLYDNAEVELNVPPLGSGTALNIRSVGYDASAEQRPAVLVQGWRVIPLDDHGQPVHVPADLADEYTPEQIKAKGERVMVDDGGHVKLGSSWTYEPGEAIRGGVAPSPIVTDLVEEVGISDVQRQQIRDIIANFHAISEQLARDPERYNKLIDDVAALAGDARSVVASLKDRSPAWFDRLDSITASLDGMLQENRPTIKQALDNAEQITRQLREQTLAKVDAALDKANNSLDDVKATVTELRTMLVVQRPVIERMIANLRLTSDQLKLTAIEVRRSPWRLLYTPSDKELETDNLYDAARSFALAAGSLESTAESLKVLVESGDGALAGDDRNLKLMLDNLHQTFEQFDEAETRFWDALDDKLQGGPAKK